MTDRELMQQALEALEQVTKELLAVRDELAERGARPTTNVFHQRLWDSSFDAYTNHAMPAAQALRNAIAEAEKQEPVAWMHRHIDGNVITHKPADLNRHPDRWTPLYKNPTPCETCQALARTVMMDQTAHDTPPAAQRQWTELTDEEIRSVVNATVERVTVEESVLFRAVARAIEAKLKERNV
jgi:hypothetical protein